MFRLSCKIEIGTNPKYTYVGVVNFESDSSWEKLTDTCKISLPKKVVYEGKSIGELIKRGDAITVSLGYDDNLEKVFQGYIKSVSTTVPIVLECEDEMYNLKKGEITKNFAAGKLKTMLDDVLAGIDYKAVDTNIGKIRMSKVTPAKVLQTLKDDFGMYSFFKDKKLYVGLSNWSDYQKTYIFDINKNVVENDLTYSIAEDTKYKVVAVSIDASNKKQEETAGDKDGDQRTFYYYDLTKKELKEIAEKELQKLKYDGYRGSFTAFGVPVVRHGDAVKIVDSVNPKIGADKYYLVKSVKREFGLGGYRQVIELDRIS